MRTQLLSEAGILNLYQSVLEVKLYGRERIKVFIHMCMNYRRTFIILMVRIVKKEKLMIELLYQGILSLKKTLKMLLKKS